MLVLALMPSSCPITIGVAADGALYFDRFHRWSKTSLKVVESVVQTGCFCADDCPKPITSVRLVTAANAPHKDVDPVLSMLTHNGWPPTRIQVEVWKDYPRKPR